MAKKTRAQEAAEAEENAVIHTVEARSLGELLEEAYSQDDPKGTTEAEATEKLAVVSRQYSEVLGRTPSYGVLWGVKCPLAGYEHMTFWYCTNNHAKWIKTIPEDKEDWDAWAEWFARFVHHVEGWDVEDFSGNLLPPLAWRKPETFRFFVEEMDLLNEWAANTGYLDARIASIKNSRGD